MGSKLGARERMERAGRPGRAGRDAAQTRRDAGIRAAALAIGLPVVVKASAGGGGKGMRVVTDVGRRSTSRLPRRGARPTRAFGDGTLYVERRVERPRHVEIQVFADAHGGCVHLFERECSIQRRHQKIVEETPSPALTPALRARMGEAAVAAARAAGYVNAGTIEFLLEGSGDDARFYFLEMNTRLQVEHAITEAVTGVDLVHAQLAVAGGAPLPWTQDQLAPRGHAIECPAVRRGSRAGLPAAGWPARSPAASRTPQGCASTPASSAATRFRSSTTRSSPRSWRTRRRARRRSRGCRAALREHASSSACARTQALLARILAHPRFRAGDVDTGFVADEHGPASRRR